MKTYVETKRGELVENLSGIICCQNDKINWETVMDWAQAQDTFTATIRTNKKRMSIELADNRTHVVGSLLEHFEYQD